MAAFFVYNVLMDPATQGGGASSHLQSQLASGSSDDSGGSPFAFVMTFGNINGFNFLKMFQGVGGQIGMGAAFGWLANSFGLGNITGGDRLSKSPTGKLFSKKAKAIKGGADLSMASRGPSVGPPSLGMPKPPGGGGQEIG